MTTTTPAPTTAEARPADGYVLVPREPTEAMLAAFEAESAIARTAPWDRAEDLYRAMLAAAPEAPEALAAAAPTSGAGDPRLAKAEAEVAYWRRDLAARLLFARALYEAAARGGNDAESFIHRQVMRGGIAALADADAEQWHQACDLCGEQIRPGEATATDEEDSGTAHARCAMENPPPDHEPEDEAADLARQVELAKAALDAPRHDSAGAGQGGPSGAGDQVEETRGLTLHVQRGKAGLYYVTSPEVPGLLVTEHTQAAALAAVPRAMANLAAARMAALKAPHPDPQEASTGGGAADPDLTRPYVPELIHYPDDDRLEFVLRDCATVALYLADGCVVLLDMGTHEPIGFYVENARRRLPAIVEGLSKSVPTPAPNAPAPAGEVATVKTLTLAVASEVRSLFGRAIEENGGLADNADPVDDLCDTVVKHVIERFSTFDVEMRPHPFDGSTRLQPVVPPAPSAGREAIAGAVVYLFSRLAEFEDKHPRDEDANEFWAQNVEPTLTRLHVLISALPNLTAPAPGDDRCGERAKPDWVARAAWCAAGIAALILGKHPNAEPIRGDGLAPDHLLFMARELKRRGLDSETKACRWLGWLQAGVVAAGISTLDAEKERNLASGSAPPATTPGGA